MKNVRKIVEDNRTKILIVVGILIVAVLGVSYAYFTVGGKQEGYNTIRSGCLSITITEESEAINLDKVVPVTIEEGLTYKPYTFTIKNNCSEASPYQVSLESIDLQETTMGIENVHISLEDSRGRRVTERLDRLEETLISNENAYDARKIYNGELEGNGTADFKFRMWLDYDATKESAASKTYKSKIVISAKDNINKDDEIIKIRYSEEASEEGSEGWYKSYTTRVSISDKKDEIVKARYCVGEEKCEPNIDVELENKSFIYEYESGSKILCTEASDSKGNRSEITCNSIIKVDKEKPRIEYNIKEENKGSNDWYQKLKIEVKGIDNESGVSSLKYCTTTEESCIPTVTSEISEVDVELTSNVSAQKICSEGIDKNGNSSGVVCSSAYKVDGSRTTTSLSVASSTAASNGWYKALSLKVQGTNSVSGVSSVKYCKTTGDTCTPTTEIANGGTVALSSNANAQRVCAQTTDNKGETSEIVCSEAYKVDTSTTTINVSVLSSTAGTNGWYKALSLKAVGTNDYSKVAKMKYCTTTSSTCTPTNEVEGDNVTVLLSTNASAQKVCAQTIDNRGEASEVQCSSAYKVDESNPTINVAVASSTAGSNSWYKALSIKGTASDTGSGVSSLKYCTTTSSTCTPNTTITSGNTVALSSNASAQKVCYQATDTSGRTSTVTCSSAYKVDTSTTTTAVTVASSTAGTNSWYKALSLKVQGTNSYSGVSSVKYCTTTSTTCTPNTTITNGNTVALSSNAGAQKVCAQTTDNKGDTSTVVCSSAYSVDNTVPTVSITSSSSTTNSITVNISGSDAHSKISTYYYKIGSGSYTSDTSTTKTFTGLTSGTTYTISVYAIDKAGNQSTVASTNVKVKTTIDNIISGAKDTPYDQIGSDAGVFKVEDGMYGGNSYYWAGNVTNNYVKFAGFCWRAIRINGDGTIRLIYDGTTCHANGTTTEDNTIALTAYVTNGQYPEMLGWTYASGKQRTTGGTSSKAKTTVETWYNNNIGNNTEYVSKVTQGKFCNDRNVEEGKSWSRVGTFNYAGERRANKKQPTLSCPAGDVYSLNVGLITADEALYSKFTYLSNGKKIFTMTPGRFVYTATTSQTYGQPYIMIINNSYLEYTHVSNYYAYLRPVINLNADVNLTGSGTMSNPYVVN